MSNDLYTDSQGISQNVIDIKKYNPIIDAAVETLIENRNSRLAKAIVSMGYGPCCRRQIMN